MKVYTRRGDSGETDLFGGGRVAKHHLRVEAYGAVDELNASLGVAASASPHGDVQRLVQRAQELLFALGGALATPDASHREKSGIPEPGKADVEALERDIDAFDAELAPLERFVLPGGTPAAAAFHVARTVCRRAERRCVELHHAEPLGEAWISTLNRLSDLLFVLARVENHRAGAGDVEWKGMRG